MSLIGSLHCCSLNRHNLHMRILMQSVSLSYFLAHRSPLTHHCATLELTHLFSRLRRCQCNAVY